MLVPSLLTQTLEAIHHQHFFGCFVGNRKLCVTAAYTWTRLSGTF